MEKNEFEISQISEISCLIEFGKEINENINKKVRAFCTFLDEHPFKGMVEYVPSFASVSVIYNPLEINNHSLYETIKFILVDILSKLDLI